MMTAIDPSVRSGQTERNAQPSVGSFRLSEMFQQTARSQLWRCRDQSTGARGVVKVCESDDAETCKAWARLPTISLDEICEMRTLVRRGQATWLLLEYLEGPTLGQLLKQQGRLPWSEARRIGAALATGLAALHRSGVCLGAFDASQVMLRADTVPLEPVLLAARSIHPPFDGSQARADALCLVDVVMGLCDSNSQDFRKTTSVGRLIQARTLVEEVPDGTEAAARLAEHWLHDKRRKVTNDDPRVHWARQQSSTALRAWVEISGLHGRRLSPRPLWRSLGLDLEHRGDDRWRLTLPILGEPRAILADMIEKVVTWQSQSVGEPAPVHMALKLVDISAPNPETLQGAPHDVQEPGAALTLDTAVWRHVRGLVHGDWLGPDVIAMSGLAPQLVSESTEALRALPTWLRDESEVVAQALQPNLNEDGVTNLCSIDGRPLWPVLRAASQRLSLPSRALVLVADEHLLDGSDLSAELLMLMCRRVTRGAEPGSFEQWIEVFSSLLPHSHEARLMAHHLAAVMEGVSVDRRLAGVSRATSQALEALEIDRMICVVHGGLSGAKEWLLAHRAAGVQICWLTCDSVDFEPAQELELPWMTVDALRHRLEQRLHETPPPSFVSQLHQLTFGHEQSLQSVEDCLVERQALRPLGDRLCLVGYEDVRAFWGEELSAWIEGHVSRIALMALALTHEPIPKWAWVMVDGTVASSDLSAPSWTRSVEVVNAEDGLPYVKLRTHGLTKLLPGLAPNAMRGVLEQWVTALSTPGKRTVSERAQVLRQLMCGPMWAVAGESVLKILQGQLDQGEPELTWYTLGVPLLQGKMGEQGSPALQRRLAQLAMMAALQRADVRAVTRIALRLEVETVAAFEPMAFRNTQVAAALLGETMEIEPVSSSVSARAWTEVILAELSGSAQWVQQQSSELRRVLATEREVRPTAAARQGVAGSNADVRGVALHRAVAYGSPSREDLCSAQLGRAFELLEGHPDAWFERVLTYVAWLRLGLPTSLCPLSGSPLTKLPITRWLLAIRPSVDGKPLLGPPAWQQTLREATQQDAKALLTWMSAAGDEVNSPWAQPARAAAQDR